jgi:subtilisin family serine protease
MYKVTYGGKKGKTVELTESPDLVAIRTKDNQNVEDMPMSRAASAVVQDSVEVASFPEAGVTVRRVAVSDAAPEALSPEFESMTMGRGAPPPDTTGRDHAREVLKQEENVRFAGRVLQDADSGQVVLYTENFFVKFVDSCRAEECESIIAKYKLNIKNKLPFATNAYFVQAEEGTGLKVFNIAETLLAEKKVEYCHPELVQERRYKEIHPLQWHLKPTQINGKPVEAHVNIEKAWQLTKGKGITIAIIDDGVDVAHPEFAGRIVHPFDATDNLPGNALPKNKDDNHGTACAGMACAAGLTNGASGTAPEAFLMPIRLRSGLGTMNEANAFAWAADNGADVISCSWGPTDGEWWNPADPTHTKETMLPDSTRLAMEYAIKKGRNGKGCVILFAAGNGNEDIRYDGYSSNPAVLTVAACNDTNRRSVYSDYGDNIWVSFPSGDYAWKALQHPAPISMGLRTTDRQKAEGYNPDNYVNSFGGTSGACPGVAGVVGLMLAVNPDLTPAQVKDVVRRSCIRIDEANGEYDANGHSVYYGYGRIDAGLAVSNAAAAAKPKPSQPATAPALSGEAMFPKSEVVSLQNNPELAASRTPGAKMTGLKLDFKPALPDVSLRYRLNITGAGILEAAAGTAAVLPKATQRIIGVAIELTGKNAKNYTIQYSARVKGGKKPLTAQDGAFCGSEGKAGSTIEGISIVVKKK